MSPRAARVRAPRGLTRWTRRTLREEVWAALEGGARSVTIDLAGTTMVDAAAVGTLIACRELAHQHGAALLLEAPPAALVERLRATTLDHVLRVQPPLRRA